MASSAPATGRIGRKKEGFKEFLQRVSSVDLDAPESELSQLNERSKELDNLAVGFRHHALSTQLRQDIHLNLYRQWASIVLAGKESGSDLSDGDLDRLCFPDPSSGVQPWARLQSQLRRFLVFAIERCVPRSIDDDAIGYQVLVHYRQSMCFWVLRKYPERAIDPPKRSWLEATMSEMMRYLQSQEILLMMDLDLRETPCIELTECHHLAWVLGRLAALRPGSLGMPDRMGNRHLPYLVWGDLQIERTSTIGAFYVKMTIRNLKTNSVDPQKAHTNKVLTISLNSPKGTTTFELSAPHRILTIALRRGVLVGIENLDDLFTQRQRHILIKDEFKEKPVLLKGANAGRSVQEDQPMSSLALTEYLKLRGTKIGLTKSITFYSIRRKTAMDLVSNLGPYMARAIMAHEPDSVGMEKYYISSRTAIPDLMSMVIGDNSSGTDTRPIDGSLAFSRLNQEQRRKLGPMLNDFFRTLREMDDGYPHNGEKKAKKNRDRVIRRAALRAAMKQLGQEQQAATTIDESNLDIEELKSMCNKFNEHVLKEARRIIATEAPELNANDENTTSVDESMDSLINLSVDFPEDNPDTLEDDAEDQFRTQIADNQTIDTFPDELEDINQLSEIDYGAAARAAMEIWLNVGEEHSAFGIKQQQGATIVCPRCQEDETVDEETKAKRYAPSRLPRHIDSEFHSAFKRFMRRAVIDAKQNNLEGLRCEICVTIAPPDTDVPAHSSQKTLARHIDMSTSSKLSTADIGVDEWWAGKSSEAKKEIYAAHDRVKTEIGWYNPDFRGDLQHKARTKRQFQRFDDRQSSEFSSTVKYSTEEELPHPIPIGYGIYRGSAPGRFEEYLNSDPALRNVIQMTEMPAADGSNLTTKKKIIESPELSSVIKFGSMPSASELGREPQFPAEWADLIQLGPMPGTPGYEKESILDQIERESKIMRKQ
ncbi:unnamed protein product [Fusarium fujikuroi]|uniref:Uncharacterized protein n=1 Tax=Fusarium fujikuroi TaxID=5127 RepID=A0A2H3RU94_FUSFU|nr:uncharacterized protein FFC1_04779 [Fusarium fujikuroi]VTT73659.1 unnamed protein product [Fusarium fujikuroi]VZH99697.1 unnamed protein product [Fusarium fujikuroi]